MNLSFCRDVLHARLQGLIVTKHFMNLFFVETTYMRVSRF